MDEIKSQKERAIERADRLWVIPPMIDEKGKYWDQPSRFEIEITPEAALMTRAAFEKLAEYSASIPSGTYAGKMWRAKNRGGWWLRWFEDDPKNPDQLLIQFRKIVLKDA